MGKMRVWITVLIIAMAAAAPAVEVISIDINNYGNEIAYSGEAAVSGASQWIAYYGGWGVPAGSPRSANLAKTGTIQASTYAEQVWIGDPGGHSYVTGASSGLLDDGFVSNTPSPTFTGNDPNISFIGLDLFGDAGLSHAYKGTFDVYLYGNSAGSFKLTDANSVSPRIIAAGAVTGTVTPGVFELGKNYVVFENISIADPNSVRLWYSNELNGIQLVGKKMPVQIQKTGTVISAVNYTAAYDTNSRDGEPTRYGPDTGYTAGIGSYVSYLAPGEYMDYDITVDLENMGQYSLTAGVVTASGSASMQIFIDGVLLGAVTCPQYADGMIYETTARTINLFPGSHTITWKTPTIRYNNIVDLRLNYSGPVVMSNCAQVRTYGFNYPGDLTGDCRVDMQDLALIIENWANCYDPQPGACD